MEIVKNLRYKKHLSLRDLSKITGLSASYIHKIELGKSKNISYKAVMLLSNALGVHHSVIGKHTM